MIVMDQSTRMPDVARFFAEFCMDESCGNASLPRWHGADARSSGENRRASGHEEGLEKLEELCDLVKHTSLCGLGQTAPNPVLSTLRFFRRILELLQPIASRETERRNSGYESDAAKNA